MKLNTNDLAVLGVSTNVGVISPEMQEIMRTNSLALKEMLTKKHTY